MRVSLTAAAAVALTSGLAVADGIPLDLDPGTNFMLYSTNTNDGYGNGRGMVFTANQTFDVNGAALYTSSSAGLNATFELWDTNGITNGDVLGGAVLIASANATLVGGLGFHGEKFADTTLQAGNSYLLRVHYQEPADENWFFDFDPGVFGDLPVDIGEVTLIDGTAGGNTSNFVAPFLQLQIVPAPGSVALLGVAGLMAVRRRR